MDPKNYITLPISKEWAALFQSTPLLLLLAGVFAIVLYLAISEHWEWLQNRPSPMPWFRKNYVAILLTFGFTVIILAVVYWIWDIRGEIGEIVSLLSTELSTQNPSAENIRNLAYAIGALLAAVALSATIPFQLIKVWVNERLAKTTEQGHMTDRITKAVEQLGAEKTVKVHRKSKKGKKLYEERVDGSKNYKKPIITETTEPNLEVRLGAIYALERIAQDSLRDHIPVMEILCAYVRLNSPVSMAKAIRRGKNKAGRNFGKNDLADDIEGMASVRTDIQAILDVIGRRNDEQISFELAFNRNPSNKKGFRIDLGNTNLQKANFDHGNFSNVSFRKSAVTGARFFFSNLSDSWFDETRCEAAQFDYSDLSRAKFYEASLYFSFCIKSKFDYVEFLDADTTNMSVGGADFSKTISVDPEQFETMIGNETTILPRLQNEKYSPHWATPIHE